MKIILIIVSVILAATAGCSGYYIYSLSGQINDLEDELALNYSGLDQSLRDTAGRLDEADASLEEALASSNATLNDTIAVVSGTLGDYKETTDSQFTQLSGDILLNQSGITSLTGRVDGAESILDSSVLNSQALYEKVHEAMVTISDGTNLLGSGFLVSFPTGGKFVVTAYHVVKGAPIDWVKRGSEILAFPKLYITLYDGSTWRAAFAARSEDADIAIIAVSWGLDMTPCNSDILPTVPLSTEDVKVGDPIFVVGCPYDYEDYRLGLEETVNTGVISQINRGATVGDKYVADMLQFDAAVNFGNSGSALFNAKGEVIGVVIGRINPLLGDGMSFAVKSSQILKVWSKVTPGEWGGVSLYDEILSPMYKYPWTGITVIDITPLEMFTNDNAQPAGAQVMSVTGPGADAGISTGDIITEIDSRVVHDTDEFYSFLIEYYAPGDSIILHILRGTEELEITLVLEEKP
jgi:S1-C subfamily serine protease